MTRRLRLNRHAPALLLLATALTVCVSLPPAPAGLTATTPVFSPETFFSGGTEGRGVLAIVARHPRAVQVHGTGRWTPAGELAVDQLVEEASKPATQQQWRIRRVAPGRYAGTLSDAAGPVVGEANGNMLRLHFRMASGLAAEQRLFLLSDGRTVLNRMTVRKLGVVLAVLN